MSNSNTWTAPVRLTDKMLLRMWSNGDWGDMSREEFERQIRGAWAEARHAAPATVAEGPSDDASSDHARPDSRGGLLFIG